MGSVVDSFTGEAVDSCLVEVWNADSTSVVGSTYNAGWGWRIDLLAELDDVTRTINAYGRTETWQNILGRYAMLSVQYRFNKKTKKKR